MAKPIAPCLWFDSNAEEAVNFYCSIFEHSEIVAIDRYTELGPGPEGSIMFIEFKLNGQDFQASTAGPNSRSARRSRLVSFALTKRRSTISGISCWKVEASQASAAG